MPPPVLQYELLAHLVRQGFIDHVISFNFDELFDEAFINELGGASSRVVTERDLLFHKSATGTPFLIKPHGTISSPLSLRFTRGDVETFPEALAEFITDRILPPPNTRAISGVPIGATIIVAGFSMRDPAFNEILQSSQVQRLYRIDVSQPSKVNYSASGPLPAPLPEVAMLHPSGVMLLDLIWQRLEKLGRQRGYVLPGLARHRALCWIFGRGRRAGSPISTEARTRADIVLAAARAKGQVALDALAMNPRISRYSQSASDLIDLASRSLLQGMAETSALEGRTYQVRDAEVLVSNLVEIQRLFGRRESSARDALRKCVDELIAGDEVAIAREDDPLNRFQFRSAEPIRSAIEMRQRTLEILQHPDVKRILAITESGYWLTQPWVRQAMAFRQESGLTPLTCEVISVRPDEMPPLSRVFTDVRKYSIPLATSATAPVGQLAIHWWEHNRHLTLGLAGYDASTSDAVAGIYFLRRQNNPLIHPVYVTDFTDIAILKDVFWRYRMKHFRRRAYVSALREAQADEAIRIMESALMREGAEVRAHFSSAIADLPRLVKLDSDSVVLGAYVRGVFLDTDLLVGILAFTDKGFVHSPFRQRTVRIDVVAVEPAWRRCGIGRLLIEAFEDRVSPHGGRTIVQTKG
ncbi:MAG: GNAT family N-acetyltransferase, partial [Acidimicrobiales bacterium]